MAKLSRRGAENWRGRVNYYIAIDGTKFSVFDYGRNRRSHKQAKADAKAHSLKILEDQGLKYVSGKLIGSDGVAYDDYGNAVAGQQRYIQDQADLTVSRSEFDTKQAEYEALIKEGGAELEELAETKAARQSGFMAQQMQNALLASGQDPTMIQSIAGRGQAATQRGLQDVLRGIQAQTTGQLAGAKQFEIGTDLSLEGIETQRIGLQDAMTQFIQKQQLERDKVQASLDMQPEWWESAVGGFGQGAVSNLTYNLRTGTCFEGGVNVHGRNGKMLIGML